MSSRLHNENLYDRIGRLSDHPHVYMPGLLLDWFWRVCYCLNTTVSKCRLPPLSSKSCLQTSDLLIGMRYQRDDFREIWLGKWVR